METRSCLSPAQMQERSVNGTQLQGAPGARAVPWGWTGRPQRTTYKA